MSHIFLMLLVLSFQQPNDQESRPNCTSSSCVDEAKALAIAEEAFLKFTHKKVVRYTVRLARQYDSKWLYVVDGLGEFAGPGEQWFITIERGSGKVLSIDKGD